MIRASQLRITFLATALALAAGPAPAAIPWRHGQVAVRADQQPADEVLRSFAAEHGLAIHVAVERPPVVSGDFAGLTARQFLDAVTDASDLAWFWDGARLYISSAADIQAKTVEFDSISADRAAGVFASLGFESGPASRPSTIRGSDGVFTLVGVPRFLEVAEPVLRSVDTQEKARRDRAAEEAERRSLEARARDGELQVRVFRLKHASATDIVVQGGSSQSVVPGVARALQNLMGAGVGSLSTGAEVTERRRRQQGLRGSGLAAVGESPSEPGVPGASGPTRTARGSESEPSEAEVLIQADPRLNAVIVRDIAARMPLYESLIAQLDVSSPVIEISAAVVDLEANNDRALGIEFLGFGQSGNTLSRAGFEADRSYNTSESGNNSSTPAFNDGPDLVRGPGLLSSVLVSANGYQLLARIRALEEKGVAQLVTSPSVITLDNVEANLEQQQTVYVRVAGEDATDLFDVRAGVRLRVTPTLVQEGGQTTFRLVVNVQDGSFSDLLVDGVPSTRESVITTQAVVPADKTLLIGGYFVDRQNNNTRQVPVLGNIPGLGRLFKRTENNQSRAQRYYFITPRLVDVQSEARLNLRPAPAPKERLPNEVSDPEKALDRANELVGRSLPATASVSRPANSETHP